MGIAEDIELHEFDIGVSSTVLGDEIVNDIRPDISKAGRPLDQLHPVKVAAWRVQQRLDGMAPYKVAQLGPYRFRPLQFRAPTAAALAVVPPVSPENIGENLLRTIGAETVYRHSFIDDRAQPAGCMIPNRGIETRRMLFEQQCGFCNRA
jgi:hypothetical protein